MRLHIENRQEKKGQMMIMRKIVLLLMLLSLGAGMALAQIKSSTITGTVSDQNGAVVAGANITITDANTGVNSAVKTNAEGEYSAPYLEQGLYVVTVQATGFETFKKTGIALATQSVVRIDAQLTVGSVSQTVEVRASTAELQTETTSIQGSVDTHVIMNIPNINDNPLYYATLQSGVVPSSEMYNNEALGVGFGDRQQMSGMNINGGEVGNNDVQVDGLRCHHHPERHLHFREYPGESGQAQGDRPGGGRPRQHRHRGGEQEGHHRHERAHGEYPRRDRAHHGHHACRRPQDTPGQQLPQGRTVGPEEVHGGRALQQDPRHRRPGKDRDERRHPGEELRHEDHRLRPYIKKSKADAVGVLLYDRLEDVLREADVITFHTPLTPDTETWSPRRRSP